MIGKTTIAIWRTGSRGEKPMGWHHDLMMVAMNFVMVTMGPERISF